MAIEMHSSVLTLDERMCVVRQQSIVDRLSTSGSKFMTMDERQDMKMAVAICRGMGGDEDLWVAGFLQDILDDLVLVHA